MRWFGGGGTVGPVDYVASLFPAEPAPGMPGDPGLFGPGSQAWRIGRERALIAAGPAALLMQLSHPLVAAGVAEHSDFQTDPLHRLRATLDATVTIVFGDTEQAGAVAARVRSRHRQVRGRTGAAVGSFAAGTSYRAGDPELGLWVHATLVWTALEFFDGFITPLSRQQRAAYQMQMNRSGRLFGVPDTMLPDSYADFERYVRSRLQGKQLQVGPQARALANEVLSAGADDLVWPLGVPASGLARVLAAGLLPPRLRAGYGLSWGPIQRQAFVAARVLCKRTVPALPPRARYWPHYLVAQARVNRQPDQRESGGREPSA